MKELIQKKTENKRNQTESADMNIDAHVEDVTALGWMSNTIAADQMTSHSNRLPSHRTLCPHNRDTVVSLLLLNYFTELRTPRKKLISDKLLNSPRVMILSENKWCL